MSEQAILDGILQREGWPKYTNLPADRGGPTKGGVTLASWREFTNNPDATAEELAAISEDQARAFYRKRYIIDPGFDEVIDKRLRELLIDAGVHHDPRHPSKWAQAAVGVKQDGEFGPITLAAINCANPRIIYWLVVARRVRLFGRLVSQDPELKRAREAGFNLQAIFAAGWNNRVAEFIETAADW